MPAKGYAPLVGAEPEEMDWALAVHQVFVDFGRQSRQRVDDDFSEAIGTLVKGFAVHFVEVAVDVVERGVVLCHV